MAQSSESKNNVSLVHELHKLSLRLRNKVRGIANSESKKALSLYNKIRINSSARELFQIEKVLKIVSGNVDFLVSSFPTEPQTLDKHERITVIDLKKQLSLLELIIIDEKDKIHEFSKNLKTLNEYLIQEKFDSADEQIELMLKKFGYSHTLVRKSALIRELACDGNIITESSRFLEDSGIGSNKVLLSSLIHCYQKEQDFLSIKRSVMSVTNNGTSSEYIKNIAKIPFHPFAKDLDELNNIILNSIRSSLIDAIIACKVNSHIFEYNEFPELRSAISEIELSSPNIDQIANNYTKFGEEGEEYFYQHSSAWYECDEICKYRIFQDHFYESPKINHNLNRNDLYSHLDSYIVVKSLDELTKSENLTSNGYASLLKLQQEGSITRSSVFNYLIDKCEGNTYISEKNLIELMGKTSDLVRTANPDNLKNMALSSGSELSKIILYLLIAKSTKNELDDFNLKKLIERRVIRVHNGKIISFIQELESLSGAIAKYTYEVCNEDFLAILVRIIRSAKDITETRASLHEWAGHYTGDKSYFDRARNIIIDHQINLVRNEIDDHRIYADVTRFKEWYEDEVAQELNNIMLISDINDEFQSIGEIQLFNLIEKCYRHFCSNNYFGIASYLGRRIRHGTFRGHLYSNVIKLESSHDFINNPCIFDRWSVWKQNFEKVVDQIVSTKLHITSDDKPLGFLNPRLHTQSKKETASLCVITLLKIYKQNGVTYSFPELISEYCWRIAEYDLKEIASFLKSKKGELINEAGMTEIKNSSYQHRHALADFTVLIRHKINEQLSSMFSWFQRPQSSAPKVSLFLLYKAVVAEVKQSFHNFNPNTDFDENEEILLVGGAYHIIYDALYVIIYNSAKHGCESYQIERKFSIVRGVDGISLFVSIMSKIKESASEYAVNKLLKVTDEQIDNAQLFENRSGIGKLYNIQKNDHLFKIQKLTCENRNVIVNFTYGLQ